MTAAPSVVELFSHIGFRTVGPTADGGQVVELDAADHVVNLRGGIQGGLLATLIDVAAGQLAVREAGAGTGVVTSDLTIRYLRPVTEGTARAVARVVHRGRRGTVIQVDVIASTTDRVAVTATASFTFV